MFFPFQRPLLPPSATADREPALVQDVQIRLPREPRSRRCEIILVLGWLLVGLKSGALLWVCRAYAVPVNPWWVITPTLIFATLCTWLYWRRD